MAKFLRTHKEMGWIQSDLNENQEKSKHSLEFSFLLSLDFCMEINVNWNMNFQQKSCFSLSDTIVAMKLCKNYFLLPKVFSIADEAVLRSRTVCFGWLLKGGGGGGGVRV